jgi:hypothetical protein
MGLFDRLRHRMGRDRLPTELFVPAPTAPAYQPGPLRPDLPGPLRPDLPGQVRPDLAGQVRPDQLGPLGPDLPGEVRPDPLGPWGPDLPGQVRPDLLGPLRPDLPVAGTRRPWPSNDAGTRYRTPRPRRGE